MTWGDHPSWGTPKKAPKLKKKKRINPKKKGDRGERLFVDWLTPALGLQDAAEKDKPRRNLDQYTFARSDIIFPPFIFEVKNREPPHDYQSYWNQCVFASRDVDLEPIVAIYTGRNTWNFLISATLIGNDLGWLLVNEFTFVPYLKRRFCSGDL